MQSFMILGPAFATEGPPFVRRRGALDPPSTKKRVEAWFQSITEPLLNISLMDFPTALCMKSAAYI